MSPDGQIYSAEEAERLDAKARAKLIRLTDGEHKSALRMTDAERVAYYAWRTAALPQERADKARAEGRESDARAIERAADKRARKAKRRLAEVA